MGTKIGSLFWEITSDTSKLEKGLADTKTKVGQFKSGLNDAVTGLTGFNLSAIGAAGAVVMIGKEIIDAVKETQAYNLSIADLAQQMGTTTEEASRLVQVGDDLRISQQSIQTAMTYAVRAGIEPSIAGISKLADQYNALATPVEKGQLLLKTFGRSGMEMGKLLEKGGQGIKDMAAGIEDGLIVTAQGAEASKRYYEQVDKLNDSWTAFKMNVGNAVIPALTDLLDGENKITDATWENVRALEAGMKQQQAYGVSVEATAKQIATMKASLSQAADTARWTGLANTFNTEVNPAIDGLIPSAGNASVAMKELTTDLIFQQAAAGLDAEAAMTLAQQMGLVNDKTVTAMTELDKLRKMYDDGTISALSYAAAVAAIKDSVDSLKSKTITVKVNYAGGAVTVNGMNVANLGPIPAPSQAGSGSSGGGMQALGGEYNVNKPTLFLAGEAGPETATFTPAGSPKATSAGGGKRQFSFYGPVYFDSPAGMESELMAIGVV